MFTTPEKVAEWTGISVTIEQVRHAQFVIESYVGRIEAEVDNVYDLTQLARATAFQAVYMRENPSIVWDQIALKQAGQNESLVTFDTEWRSPYIHRMAAQACSKLSWLRTRSIKTGPVFSREPRVGWEFD